VPPAVIARWLASNRLSRPGVLPPELAIEPEPFFAELAKRGFTTTLTKTETVAAGK
jgi:saccharopine dehydrogenase-like NADP-dependent oxidoreductase